MDETFAGRLLGAARTWRPFTYSEQQLLAANWKTRGHIKNNSSGGSNAKAKLTRRPYYTISRDCVACRKSRGLNKDKLHTMNKQKKRTSAMKSSIAYRSPAKYATTGPSSPSYGVPGKQTLGLRRKSYLKEHNRN